MALARELRVLGHHVTVLAPLDRDRSGHALYASAREDEAENLVGLGRSVRVRSNGSIAPIALGPTASVRAIAALRVGQFDVLHLHEPLAPGASYACLCMSRPVKVGTFHRSGESALYSLLRPLARGFADRLQVRCAVSQEALSTAKKALGGTYELIGNGVEVDRFSDADPSPTDGPTVMFVGRHEKRKGLAVLLDAFSRVKNPRRGLLGGRAGARDGEAERDVSTEPLHRVARPYRRRRACDKIERIAYRVLPFPWGRVFRGRVARGHGGPIGHRRK